MKNPLTPAGIEPATFPFAARHLDHCATAELRENNSLDINVTMLKPVRMNLSHCTETSVVEGEVIIGRISLSFVDILKLRS